jgi:hypothetical protein
VDCLWLLSLAASGCGAGKGELSGKVFYKGKPLVYGSVLLIGCDAKPRTTWIQEDGSYHFDDVPSGQAKLAVYSPDPAKHLDLKKRAPKDKPVPKNKPIAPASPAVDRKKWFAIPKDYGDVDHSGLRVGIERGPNTYHLEMK